MQDKPVVGLMYKLPRDVFDELLFGLQGCLGITGKTKPSGNPEYMGVNGHVRLLVND
jgi:hypothetical protein